jgi:hypothetical protein
MKRPKLDRGVERASYRLSSLVLVQAIAWLGEGSSIFSVEKKEKELLRGKEAVGHGGRTEEEFCCELKWLLPCGCSHNLLQI